MRRQTNLLGRLLTGVAVTRSNLWVIWVLINMIWPIRTATQAAPDRPGIHWQVANLSHDVKKTIAPTCQTGLTNKTVYVKAWADVQPYTLSAASNTFINSTQVIFAGKKNVWKARYGTLCKKISLSDTEQHTRQVKA